MLFERKSSKAKGVWRSLRIRMSGTASIELMAALCIASGFQLQRLSACLVTLVSCVPVCVQLSKNTNYCVVDETDNWNKQSHPCREGSFGTWTCFIEDINGAPAIKHDTRIKVLAVQRDVFFSQLFFDIWIIFRLFLFSFRCRFTLKTKTARKSIDFRRGLDSFDKTARIRQSFAVLSAIRCCCPSWCETERKTLTEITFFPPLVARYWDPPKPYVWCNESPLVSAPQSLQSLKIYEAHVGMASHEVSKNEKTFVGMN